jgi:flavin reductase (DIM6/NTAB) family NADH-FMN oxidoreductase RutF
VAAGVLVASPKLVTAAFIIPKPPGVHGIRMATDDASAALGAVQSTLLIVGTEGPQGAHFMVANWGTQASFDPWRYVIAIKKTARTLEYLQKRKAFTISLLGEGEDAKALVKKAMGKKTKEGLPAEKSSVDAPRLAGSLAGWDCKVLEVKDAGGDHVLVIADIVDGWSSGEEPRAVTVQELDLSYAG